MNIASLCNMNEITLPKDREAILAKLEEVFGKASVTGDEYCFGEKIGLVTKIVDENRVTVRLVDQNGDDILWNGKPVELIRKTSIR
jgi:putative heme degradation protein